MDKELDRLIKQLIDYVDASNTGVKILVMTSEPEGGGDVIFKPDTMKLFAQPFLDSLVLDDAHHYLFKH